MASAPITSTLSFADRQLAIYDWPTTVPRPRGTVVLVHGLSEHAGRYGHVAEQLNAWGFDVRGYDQYGHGLSSGPRGRLPTQHRLIDDLAAVVAHTREHLANAAPLIVLGHSMGGLVVARALAEKACRVDAAVLSSPAFGAFTNPVQKLLLATMPKLLPHLRVGNGLQLAWLARDAQAVRAYREDRLVHDRISAQLAAWIIGEGEKAVQQAPAWDTPALLIYAGQDRLVNPQGSIDFAQAAPATVLHSQCFNVMYHEIFNDPEKHLVFNKMNTWLDQQFPVEKA